MKGNEITPHTSELPKITCPSFSWKAEPFKVTSFVMAAGNNLLNILKLLPSFFEGAAEYISNKDVPNGLLFLGKSIFRLLTLTFVAGILFGSGIFVDMIHLLVLCLGVLSKK